eukprot:TRINITY_DN7491_c0_g1_i8.p2 TRINITY_DN7491_c0_g1~~TRINITY_DN7491_c0_g1_i8.p2  ORF type:complete len:315 (+),score=72.54 TRINITY_DN7491_c0_g1_i8:100-1044(+)
MSKHSTYLSFPSPLSFSSSTFFFLTLLRVPPHSLVCGRFDSFSPSSANLTSSYSSDDTSKDDMETLCFQLHTRERERIQRLFTREKVIREILQTEKDYIEDMKMMIDVFMNRLHEAGIISENESWILFCNIKDLIRVNVEMLRKFLERRDQTFFAGKPLEEMELGDIFCDAAEPLLEYKVYCTNQPTAVAFLTDATSGNKEFADFLKECMNSPACRGMALMSWLIKPLQRLCKYPLLLRELIKHTPEDWKDHVTLLKAEKKIGLTVLMVNEETRKAEQEVEEEKVSSGINAEYFFFFFFFFFFSVNFHEVSIFY